MLRKSGTKILYPNWDFFETKPKTACKKQYWFSILCKIITKKSKKKFGELKTCRIFDPINNTKTNKMKNQMSIREIRRVLFETEKYTVIGTDEMTNKESRDFFYSKDNQDELMNVIDNGSHLLIWK